MAQLVKCLLHKLEGFVHTPAPVKLEHGHQPVTLAQ